ncbi:catalase-like domain-containing protein [Hypoxylon sp. FL0543]|nr:catalase-like domain-containing protein [Hypoxylon sp. FL0543]
MQDGDHKVVAKEAIQQYTTSNGCPMSEPKGSLSVSNLLLLQDFHLVELLSHLNRERIPERVVHAKGAGAYGEFEVTHDISDICNIDMLLGVLKKTPCLVRFSTTTGERGSADSVRDPRGFAVKCYTAEGNWDWVWNDVPFFFIRDPIKFPAMVHAHKRDPRTGLRDPTRFWDWVVQNQESLHMIMWLFSDYGTFSTYRNMNGYMGHAHKWVMPDGSFKYVHMYLEADLGYRNHADEDIARMTGADADFAARDLHDAIERGDFPTYTAKVQVIDPADMGKFGYNILDMTKHWDMGTYPTDMGTVGARPFGRLTLHRNPDNYFAEVEQAAFSPSHLVPGIQPSEDPMLQARMFAYPDAQRYRLGVNYQQFPVNRPKNTTTFNPLLRDGRGTVTDNYGANPGYVTSKAPMLFHGTENKSSSKPSLPQIQPPTNHFEWAAPNSATSRPFLPLSEVDFKFARTFWTHLDDPRYEGWQERMVRALGRDISGAKEETRKSVFDVFAKIDKELSERVQQEVARLLSSPASRGRD